MKKLTSSTHNHTRKKMHNMQYDYSTASHHKCKQRLGCCFHRDHFMWFSSCGNLTKSLVANENHQQNSNIWLLPTHQWRKNTFIFSSCLLRRIPSQQATWNSTQISMVTLHIIQNWIRADFFALRLRVLLSPSLALHHVPSQNSI